MKLGHNALPSCKQEWRFVSAPAENRSVHRSDFVEREGVSGSARACKNPGTISSKIRSKQADQGIGVGHIMLLTE